MPNAIDTLRKALETYHEIRGGESYAYERRFQTAALERVEALLQAAQALEEGFAVVQSTDEAIKLDALAAAVRRVTGDTT